MAEGTQSEGGGEKNSAGRTGTGTSFQSSMWTSIKIILLKKNGTVRFRLRILERYLLPICLVFSYASNPIDGIGSNPLEERQS